MIKEFEKRILSSFILIPISIFFIIQGSVFFTFFLSILFLVTSYEWLKMSKKNDLMKIIGIIFLLFSFYAAYNVRVSGSNLFLFTNNFKKVPCRIPSNNQKKIATFHKQDEEEKGTLNSNTIRNVDVEELLGQIFSSFCIGK